MFFVSVHVTAFEKVRRPMILRFYLVIAHHQASVSPSDGLRVIKVL